MRLKLDPGLGAGNFLHHAYALNPARTIPLVYGDAPFQVLGGRRLIHLSIADLKELVDRYAEWFLRRGIQAMDPVAVFFGEGVQYLVQYAALTAIGAVPILTNGALDSAVAARHFRRVGAVAIVTDRERRDGLAPHFRNGELKFIEVLEEIPGGDPADLPQWYPFRHEPDDPVMITHSSGTTGIPKPVMLQHGHWFHGIRDLLGLETAQGADRYLSSLPTSHNAAIAYAIHAILNGAALMIMSDRGGKAVADAIERFRPATIVSFPQTYVELTEADLPSRDFSSVTTWINSGDAAHEAHIRQLVAHGFHRRGEEVVPGSQFVDGLGSSEMGHSSFRVIHTAHTDTYDRCVGLPQHWVEAEVFDDWGEPVADGSAGRLGVRSPSVTPGYWNDSLLTYRSRLRGYWLTGDIVSRDRFGCFYHLDRVSDVIATASGPLYSLQCEERVLKFHPELLDCTIVGVPEPLLLAVPRAGRTVDAESLLREVNSGQARFHLPPLAQARVVAREEIPTGVTGKVLKRELRERVVAGGGPRQASAGGHT